MNFLQNLLVRGEGPPEDEANAAGAGAAEVQQPQLSQDELRRRRLARYEQSAGAASDTTASSPNAPTSEAAQEPQSVASATPRTMGTPSMQAPPVKVAEEKQPLVPPAEAASTMKSSTASAKPVQNSSSVKRDTVNEALVQLLRISLAPSALKGVMPLPMVAAEISSSSLSESTLDSALYGRLYTDLNDLDPRPTESPLRYVLGCLERIPAVRRNYRAEENAEVGSAIETAKKLLVNFTVTYLTEPGLFPSSCLAKSANGPCNPEHEAIDLLRRPETSANFVHLLQTILPEVINQKCGKDIVLPILQKLSKDQSEQKNENFEFVLSQLCCARLEKVGGWGQFIAEILAEEWKSTEFNKKKSFFEPFSHGRRFETDSILGPFFSTPQIVIEPGTVPTQALIEAKRKQLASRLSSLKQAVMDICRTGEAPREEMLRWFEHALELNAERSKDRPDKLKISSEPFANNICAVLLHLCEPFLASEKSTTTLPILVTEVMDCIASSKAFPKDLTRLSKTQATEELRATTATSSSEPQQHIAKKAKKFKFQTRAFTLTLRAMDLGPIVTYRTLGLLHRQARWVREDEGENGEHYKQLVNVITTFVAFGFEHAYIELLLGFATLTSRWFTCLQLGFSGEPPSWNERENAIPETAWTSGLNSTLRDLPEFVVSDVADMFVQVGQHDPLQLDAQGPEKLRAALDFFIFMIGAGDSIVAQPHVRANMGDAIFYSFLPDEAKQQRSKQSMWARRGPKELVLETSPLAQVHLVPALMRLYGDVQVTGYYQVAAHRQLITKVLGYLWTMESHRPAFRTFAQTSLMAEAAGGAPEDSAFVKLANGILNQTNSNVAESLAKLREIRKTQQDMKNAQAWAELPEDVRNQRTVLLESNEKEVSACLMMANDATDMLSYLSTDPTFVQAFTIPALRSRLVDMLCNILASLGSRKASEFKIDNPEKYNFFPKKMLEEVFQTLLNCAKVVQGREEEAKSFVRAVATCAYYDYDTFTHAARLIRKHGIVNDEQSLDLFIKFVEDCERAKREVEAMEAALGDIPDDFLDPLMSTLMDDPVILPGSKVTVDRSTIMNHLLQNKNDPFDRSPLDPSS